MSCASKQLKTSIEDPKKDSLQDESLFRYTLIRMRSLVDNGKNIQGLVECHKGDISKGLSTLKAQWKERKRDSKYFNQLGVCHYLDKNYGKAEFYFSMSLNRGRNKSYMPAVHNLALLKFKERHYSSAMAEFEKIVKKYPRAKVAKYNLGHIYLKFGQIDNALKLFTELNRVSPNDNDVLSALGIAHLYKRNLKKSWKYFGKIPDSRAARPDVAINKALCLFEMGRYEEASDLISNSSSTGINELNNMKSKLADLISMRIEEVVVRKQKLEAQKVERNVASQVKKGKK